MTLPFPAFGDFPQRGWLWTQWTGSEPQARRNRSKTRGARLCRLQCLAVCVGFLGGKDVKIHIIRIFHDVQGWQSWKSSFLQGFQGFQIGHDWESMGNLTTSYGEPHWVGYVKTQNIPNDKRFMMNYASPKGTGESFGLVHQRYIMSVFCTRIHHPQVFSIFLV